MDFNLLTPAQAGKLIGKSESTLAIWRCNRKPALPYVRLGNRIYYRREDLEKFIQGCVVMPKASR